jgi:hypothetical protein
MSLVKQDLQDGIKAALQSASDQNWTLDQIAAAWAEAVHAYVSAAEVKSVSSSVAVDVTITGSPTAHGTGTATQSGSVHLS